MKCRKCSQSTFSLRECAACGNWFCIADDKRYRGHETAACGINADGGAHCAVYESPICSDCREDHFSAHAS